MLEETLANYYTEEHFSVDSTDPPKVTFKNVTEYVSLIIAYWSLWLIVTILCLAVEQWHWEWIDFRLRYLIVGFGLFAAYVNITFMPRRVIITRGSNTFDLYWGYHPLAFRFVIPVDQIKGIYVSSQRYGKGSVVPHLAFVWRDQRNQRNGLQFARYPENDVAVKRANDLSELTGLPVIIVGLREVMRRRKL